MPTHQTRARALQRVAEVPYQKCLQSVLKNGSRALQLSESNAWPVIRADAYLLDAMLDPDYAAAARRGRYVSERECEHCGRLFFVAVDKKGVAESESQFCSQCHERGGVVECARCGTEMVGESDGEADFCENCIDFFASE